MTGIFENTPLWRLKRLVTLSTYRRYINECIYVSIYDNYVFVVSSDLWLSSIHI